MHINVVSWEIGWAVSWLNWFRLDWIKGRTRLSTNESELGHVYQKMSIWKLKCMFWYGLKYYKKVRMHDHMNPLNIFYMPPLCVVKNWASLPYYLAVNHNSLIYTNKFNFTLKINKVDFFNISGTNLSCVDWLENKLIELISVNTYQLVFIDNYHYKLPLKKGLWQLMLINPLFYWCPGRDLNSYRD